MKHNHKYVTMIYSNSISESHLFKCPRIQIQNAARETHWSLSFSIFLYIFFIIFETSERARLLTGLKYENHKDFPNTCYIIIPVYIYVSYVMYIFVIIPLIIRTLRE